ncbi:MAG: amidohydrolase family protein [Armatimonadetes bacterium]|nr:amidohydrolase family protein [Armatimonadota bacterium]
MFVVDAHFHLPPNVTDDDLKLLADSGEVAKIWLLSLPTFTHWGLDAGNDDRILKVSEKFPGFLVPFGFLDLTRPASVVDELKARGFVGLKAHTPPKPYGDESYFEHYARAEALRMPVVFHCGHFWQFPEGGLAVEGGYVPTWNTSLYTLDLIAKRFPGLTIIGAHLGWPYFQEAMALALTHSNVYFDVSLPLHMVIQAAKEAIIEKDIGTKLLFGTDLFLLRVPVRKVIERAIFWRQYLEAIFGLELGGTPLAEAGRQIVELVMGRTAERILSGAASSG